MFKLMKLVEILTKYLFLKETDKNEQTFNIYSKLIELEEKYNVTLSKKYTPDDDSNVMKQEYDYHMKISKFKTLLIIANR